MTDFRDHPDYDQGFRAAKRGKPQDTAKGVYWNAGWLARRYVERELSDWKASENARDTGTENGSDAPGRTVTSGWSETPSDLVSENSESPTVDRNVQGHTDKPDSEKLEPCPFCGAQPKLLNPPRYRCTGPLCEVRGVVCGTEEEARHWWNQRK